MHFARTLSLPCPRPAAGSALSPHTKLTCVSVHQLCVSCRLTSFSPCLFRCPCCPCCPCWSGLPQLRTLHVGGCGIKDKEAVDAIAGGGMEGMSSSSLWREYLSSAQCGGRRVKWDGCVRKLVIFGGLDFVPINHFQIDDYGWD